jgi:hypothetical protein
MLWDHASRVKHMTNLYMKINNNLNHRGDTIAILLNYQIKSLEDIINRVKDYDGKV